MSLLDIAVLAVVQGMAELLPVSSSAHVVVTEKLLGLDPSSPPMTLLLVMLHTGTMFAVIVYFWKQWQSTYLESRAVFKRIAWLLVFATALTGLMGEAVIKLIERTLFRGHPHAMIEDLFGHLELIAPALAVVGILILIAGIFERRTPPMTATSDNLTLRHAGVIGAIQGLCLPFRGFSRSGATISTGMLMGLGKSQAEAFSFALAVILTPPVVTREIWRLIYVEQAGEAATVTAIFSSMLGAALAFLAGLVALRWLSRWLEAGRWYLFGIYCLLAAIAVGYLHHLGY